MSLLDDLRAAGRSLDTQFQVTTNEIPSILSALVYHIEHPQDFLKAAEDGGVEAVTELLAPAPPERPAEPVPADPTAPADPVTDADIERQISDLQDQLASRQATAGQTTVTHEPGAGEVADPSAPLPADPAAGAV